MSDAVEAHTHGQRFQRAAREVWSAAVVQVLPLNIYLIPYTWIRHISLGLVTGGAAVVTWWCFLVYMVYFGMGLYDSGMLFTVKVHGTWFMVLQAVVMTFVSLFAEGALYRDSLIWRMVRCWVGVVVATIHAFLLFFMINSLIEYVFISSEMAPLMEDRSLTTLRYTIVQWLAMGWVVGTSCLAVRFASRVISTKVGIDLAAQGGASVFGHTFGAITAAGMGAAVWQLCGMHLYGDLYLAAPLGVFVWGFMHGALSWAVPRDLYAGWVRVISDHRFPYRIPIDKLEGGLSERFVGHFPRGLDLFLAADQGNAELHVSFMVDDDQRYFVRGLSIWPTLLKRFLESLELRWDPSRPAPLQTELQQGDRVMLSDGRATTVLEFLMLPKEER